MPLTDINIEPRETDSLEFSSDNKLGTGFSKFE